MCASRVLDAFNTISALRSPLIEKGVRFTHALRTHNRNYSLRKPCAKVDRLLVVGNRHTNDKIAITPIATRSSLCILLVGSSGAWTQKNHQLVYTLVVSRALEAAQEEVEYCSIRFLPNGVGVLETIRRLDPFLKREVSYSAELL